MPEAGTRLATIHVRRKPGNPCRGVLTFGSLNIECALGRGSTTAFKREGDGATPIGRHDLLRGHYRKDRLARPAAPFRFTSIGPHMGWCDAPADRNYNRPVRLPYRASHETMIRKDNLYDIVIVLDWNTRPRRRNAGSAIFFHLAHSDYRPTEGCIAVSSRDMRRLLPLLRPNTRFVVHR